MISPSTSDKPNEWNSSRSVRRFPENSNTINNNNNNNNVIKLETPNNNENRLHQEYERDRHIQDLSSASLMKSTNLRPSESDPTSYSSSPSRMSRISDSSSNTLCEDISFNNLKYTMSGSHKPGPMKAPKPNLSNIHIKTGSPKKSIDSTDSPIAEDVVASVISKGDYLLKYQWNSFISVEELKKYPKKIIERNDNIWEMVSLHYGCLNRLVILRDVYSKSYPYLEAGSNQVGRSSSTPRNESSNSDRHGSITDRSSNLFESIESIVPGLDPLIKCFAKITNNLVNNHLIRPDRVITDIGRVLNESINDKLCSTLAKLYGHFNYQRNIASQKLNLFKKYPTFLSYIHKCERDPRSEKKTLSDYIQDISMFWARMTIPLNLIIEKTMNDSQEVNFLTKYKEKIQKLIIEAENIQGKFANTQLLKNIIENYETIPDCKESERVYDFMTAENATLVYMGIVQFELRKSNTGRVFYRDLTGVALENCLFFLISNTEPGKNICKYQLFQDRDSFPALLEWGKLYGYFREEDSKNTNSFSFYVIIEKPEPSIKRLFVSTTTERNCWKNCMMQGFSRWQNENSIIKEAEDRLREDLKHVSVKWSNTQHGIELIRHLDHSLKVQFGYRTTGFRCILEEELKRLSASGRNSNTSTNTVTDSELKRDQADGPVDLYLETYIPDLTTTEGIHDWLEAFMEWVNRLKFSLCSSGANITRSASEIEARKRPSIQTVKKCETFTSHDSPTYEKRQTDVTFFNPPITKQKKDQRRISVSGFTNLFRINSKMTKHDEADKGNDPSSTMDSIEINEKELAELSTFDADVESDTFMSNLSKDTVIAFNEINNAAKNITMELIELRSQKLIYDSTIEKLKEENLVYKEFHKKIQKCSADSQGGLSSCNSAHLKSESIHSPFVWNPSLMGNSDIMTDSMESSTDNSTNFVSQSNQMAECRRQTEYLRQMYEQFANEKKRWEKEYESQKLKIEKEKDSLQEKQMELKKEKENLAEREAKHKEKLLELQDKLDMYFKNYQISFDEKGESSPSLPNNKIKQLSQSSPHSRSHSDDVSLKRNSQSPISPPLAPTEIASYSVDSRPTPVEIPDQLRGSLINQAFFHQRLSVDLPYKERQSLKTNSSDNILDSRGKHSSINFSTHKPKMTPNIDRKELYSNSNACFSIDDVEDKDWSSDIDDVTFQQRKTTSIGGTSKPISRNDEKVSIRHSANMTGSVHPNSRTTPTNSNQPASLGIPLELAAKSKVKKDKSRKIFKQNIFTEKLNR